MTCRILATSVAVAFLALAPAHAANAENSAVRPVLPPALSTSELAGLSGGASPTGVAISNQTLSALNSGNSVNADSVTTGNVSIDAGAFSGFSGVGNFVFNTGNNNNLQGSLSITIVTPAAN